MSTAILYIILGRGAARAETLVMSGASSPHPTTVVGPWGQVDDACDEVDDTSDQNACEEREAANSSDQADQGDETANQVHEKTDETANQAGERTEESGNQADEPIEETGNQAGETADSQSVNKEGQATNQAGRTSNRAGQTANDRAASRGLDPLGWVAELTDRVVDLVGGLVGSVADFLAGSDTSTEGSHRSGSRNAKEEGNSQLSQGGEAGNDESGESAASSSADDPTRGDAPEPWWRAWLPFTGSQWVLLAVGFSLVLIGFGLAFRSLRRRRRPRTVRV
jgi:hypothetical protein